MSNVTLRVLHGADRGKVYDEVSTPVTIGREEGNTIQLNDERISRYHLKLQADHSKIVLTDLDSTNGTKVNGEEIHVRIVRDGDMIALGRSVLLMGSHSDIDRRIADIECPTIAKATAARAIRVIGDVRGQLHVVQIDRAAGVPIRLQALEDGLPVVQHQGRRR